jgi:hypothetical protein
MGRYLLWTTLSAPRFEPWRAEGYREISEYGLTDQEISNLRRWAQSWSDDINRRLYSEAYVDDEDEEIP